MVSADGGIGEGKVGWGLMGLGEIASAIGSKETECTPGGVGVGGTELGDGEAGVAEAESGGVLGST